MPADDFKTELLADEVVVAQVLPMIAILALMRARKA